jgi:hypothetical protein
MTMKTNLRTIIALAFIMLSVNLSNAQLQLPRPSPNASVNQTVGLTDVKIEYSSPGVKGRTIFGGLLAYDKIWRTGANASTQITLSETVTIMDNEVPAGTYSVFTIPSTTEWTFILNKNVGASENSYKQDEDQLRVMIKPTSCNARERMMFSIENFDDEKGEIVLEWEKTRIVVPFMVGTAKQAEKNISSHLGRTWRDYNSAARYHLAEKSGLDKGLNYVNQSIALNENWFNTWTKAEIYNAMGKGPEAHKNAVMAKELGDAADNFFFKDSVYKAVEEWAPGAKNKRAK